MVIDTSALLAILQDEPERRTFNEAIEAAETRLMSTATLVETSTFQVWPHNPFRGARPGTC
jgi:ribonuclease VapC